MPGPRPELDCALVSAFSVQDGKLTGCWCRRAEIHACICYEGESSSLALPFLVVVYGHLGYEPRI